MSFYRNTRNRYCHWYCRSYHKMDLTEPVTEIAEAMGLLLSNGYVNSVWTTDEQMRCNLTDPRLQGSLGDFIARVRVSLAKQK